MKYEKKYYHESSIKILEIPFVDWLTFSELDSFECDNVDIKMAHTTGSTMLANYFQLVTVVHVGETYFKYDGKSDKTVWLAGEQPPPDFIKVRVIKLIEDEFLQLKSLIQGKQNRVLALDEVAKEAYVELGLSFASERMKNGYIGEALNIALRGKPRQLQDKRSIAGREEINLKKAIAVFKEELMLIDKLSPRTDIFVSGVLGGALIMLANDKKFINFFSKLNDRQGESRGELDDPITMLLSVLDKYIHDDKMTPSKLAIDLCRKTVHAVTLWEEGVESTKYWRRYKLGGVDHLPYIRKLKRQRHIDDQKDL